MRDESNNSQRGSTVNLPSLSTPRSVCVRDDIGAAVRSASQSALSTAQLAVCATASALTSWMRQIVFGQVVIQSRARSAEVGNACRHGDARAGQDDHIAVLT